MITLTAAAIRTIRNSLLDWWSTNRRDLPWRLTRDPYRIMVSEIMLQQTQVERVRPYYDAWLERFPTVQDLAAAPTADVIRRWKGLGYNRRAVNMQRTAQAVVAMGGRFPETVDGLLALPGIGPYTAGAIACFAFEQDVAFLDTNMRRVIHRLIIGVDVPRPILTDRQLLPLAEALVPPGDGWRWNQALMEFGALHCTARKPLCISCPLQHACAATPHILTALQQYRPDADRGATIPFEQTNRYFRGRIIDTLRAHHGEGVALSEIGPAIKRDYAEADEPWLLELVTGLERDGLARIAEADAGYDATDPLVRLPD